MSKTLRLLMLLFVAPAMGYAQQAVFKRGDNVCFVGNSITQNGEFHHQIGLFYATRFPDEKINIYNNGIGGNSSGDILRRIQYDVLNCRPTWSVVKLGMNDVNRELYLPGKVHDQAWETGKQRQFDIYQKNVRAILDTLLAHHSRVILQTPTIYDQTSTMAAPNFKGRNDALGDYSKFIKKLGKAYGLQVVDYRSILLKINKKLQAADPAATVIGPDRVHPGPAGHFVMAWQFLKTTGAPKYVSAVTVDAVSGHSKTNNATVSGVTLGKLALHFSSMEQALPFPVAEAVAPALELIPFINDFNQELVAVKHLKQGNYQVKIDGVTIGSFTAKVLGKGINLAMIPAAPQYQQSLKVLTLYQEYTQTEADIRSIMSMEYNQLRLRRAITLPEAESEYTRMLNQPVTDSVAYRTLKNLQASYLNLKARQPGLATKLAEKRDAVYQANKPVAHTFTITAVD